MLKIMIAVDGSEFSLDAVRHALRLRDAGLKAGFVLANVQEPASLYEMLTVHDAQRLQDLTARAGEHSLQAARDLFHSAGVDYEVEVASGDPAHTLLDIAENYHCSAIIAGARGKSGGGGDLGSVAHELMHVSRLPITIVKHPEAPDRLREQQLEREAAPSQDADPQPVIGLA